MKIFFVIIAISLLSSTAFAHHDHLGTDGDAHGSQFIEHNNPGSRATSAGQQGEGDLYGSHIANPEDVAINPYARVQPIDQAAVQAMNADPDGNLTH